MKHRIVALGLAALVMSTPAFAQEGPSRFYGEVGFTELFAAGEEDSPGNQSDTVLGSITGRVGARLNPYFGVEGELSLGVVEDEDSDEVALSASAVPFTVTTKLRNAYAGYVIGSIPMSERIDFFGRIGLGHAEVQVEARAPALDLAERVESGGDFFALGLGGRYMFGDRNGVRADYTHYELADEGGDLDSVSISFVRNF